MLGVLKMDWVLRTGFVFGEEYGARKDAVSNCVFESFFEVLE